MFKNIKNQKSIFFFSLMLVWIGRGYCEENKDFLIGSTTNTYVVKSFAKKCGEAKESSIKYKLDWQRYVVVKNEKKTLYSFQAESKKTKSKFGGIFILG